MLLLNYEKNPDGTFKIKDPKVDLLGSDLIINKNNLIILICINKPSLFRRDQHSRINYILR